MKLLMIALLSIVPMISFSAEKDDIAALTARSNKQNIEELVILKAPSDSYQIQYSFRKLWTSDTSEDIIKQIKEDKKSFYEKNGLTQTTNTIIADPLEIGYFNNSIQFSTDVRDFSYVEKGVDINTLSQKDSSSQDIVTYGRTINDKKIPYFCTLQSVSVNGNNNITKRKNSFSGNTLNVVNIHAIYDNPSNIKECEFSKNNSTIMIQFSYLISYDLNIVSVKGANKSYGQLLNIPIDNDSAYNNSALFYIPTNIYKRTSDGNKSYLYYFYELTLVKN